MKTMRIILIVIGSLLIADTIFAATRCNMNLGVIMPAMLGLPLLLVGIFLPHMAHGFLAFVKWAVFACYCIGIGIFIVCGVLMGSAISDKEHTEADAVIVLGAALHGDRVTWVLSNRLDAAIEYLNLHEDALVVVSGGQGSGETRPEGDAMADYLLERGIERDRIIIENRATNTRENFLFSMALIEERLGPDASIAYVTTDFHVYRAGKIAAKLGIAAKGIAADDVWYIRINNFMRESVGICIYALRGDI
ncbi:MAG: YdcF family protein [Clostridia bacterium]|nr:YdcF family protein [Clostridia bacterium]